MYIYLGIKAYKYIKAKVDIKPAILSFGVYVGVIAIMLLISLIWQPILFSRYLFVITGLYIFWIAYMLSKEVNIWVLFVIYILIVVLGTMSNVENINLYYNKENIDVYDYIGSELQEGDIIIYSDVGPRRSYGSNVPRKYTIFSMRPNLGC